MTTPAVNPNTCEATGSARRLDVHQREEVGATHTVRQRNYDYHDKWILPDLAEHMADGWTFMGFISGEYIVTGYWSRPNDGIERPMKPQKEDGNV